MTVQRFPGCFDKQKSSVKPTSMDKFDVWWS